MFDAGDHPQLHRASSQGVGRVLQEPNNPVIAVKTVINLTQILVSSYPLLHQSTVLTKKWWHPQKKHIKDNLTHNTSHCGPHMNEVSLAEMSSGGPPHPGAAWRQLADRESGFPYYWNTATNQVSNHQVSNHPLQAFIHHEPETKKVRNSGLGPDLVQG